MKKILQVEVLKRYKNLKDLYCELLPHSLSLNYIIYQAFVIVLVLSRRRIAFAI